MEKEFKMYKQNYSLSTETRETFSFKKARKSCGIFDKSAPSETKPMLSASRPRKFLKKQLVNSGSSVVF